MDPVALNRMLEARIKDLAHRGSHFKGEDARLALLRALGLDPLPAKTELHAQITAIIQRDGYRVEKLRYESFPGLLVTAHLYIPDGKGPFPVIQSPHGHFTYKKIDPPIQARGISLALEGFATLIVDSPGVSWDRNAQNERMAIGDHDDWFLNLGMSIQGVYLWDLIRGLDYLETRSEIDMSRVGITGGSGGGTASMYAFALEPRIKCAVPVCYATSYEIQPHNGCLCNHVPGVLLLGDRSDLLAMRAPAPVFLIGATVDSEYPPEAHRKTFDKLRSIYKSHRAEANLRLEIFEGPHDYNRRMREAMVAFFREHLMGEERRGAVPEKRPLTDGFSNPYQAGTAPIDDPRLMVTTWFQRDTKSFRDLLDEFMAFSQPEPFQQEDRLVGWGRYGKIPKAIGEEIVTLYDQTEVAPNATSIMLPIDEIDQRSCIYLGLSIPEFLGQVLHYALPGGHEPWESKAGTVSPDAITSMIASVRTLVTSANPEVVPRKIIAVGRIASMAGQFLKLLRPELELELSHTSNGWRDALDLGIRQLVQPNGRYLSWPFASQSENKPI